MLIVLYRGQQTSGEEKTIDDISPSRSNLPLTQYGSTGHPYLCSFAYLCQVPIGVELICNAHSFVARRTKSSMSRAVLALTFLSYYVQSPPQKRFRPCPSVSCHAPRPPTSHISLHHAHYVLQNTLFNANQEAIAGRLTTLLLPFIKPGIHTHPRQSARNIACPNESTTSWALNLPLRLYRYFVDVAWDIRKPVRHNVAYDALTRGSPCSYRT